MGKNITVGKMLDVLDWDAWSCREWFKRAERDDVETKSNNAEEGISIPKQKKCLRRHKTQWINI